MSIFIFFLSVDRSEVAGGPKEGGFAREMYSFMEINLPLMCIRMLGADKVPYSEGRLFLLQEETEVLIMQSSSDGGEGTEEGGRSEQNLGRWGDGGVSWSRASETV